MAVSRGSFDTGPLLCADAGRKDQSRPFAPTGCAKPVSKGPNAPIRDPGAANITSRPSQPRLSCDVTGKPGRSGESTFTPGKKGGLWLCVLYSRSRSAREDRALRAFRASAERAYRTAPFFVGSVCTLIRRVRTTTEPTEAEGPNSFTLDQSSIEARILGCLVSSQGFCLVRRPWVR